MRLPRETIKQGLLHENLVVRTAALSYFASDHRCGTDLLPLAIEALQRYGDDAFEWFFQVTDLPLDRETIQWTMAQLEDNGLDKTRTMHLSRQLGGAPLDLLQRFRSEILSLEQLSADERSKIERRLELADEDPEAAWTRLRQVTDDLAEVEEFPNVQLGEASLLLEPIARAGDRFAERTLELLQRAAEPLPELEPDDLGPDAWLVGVMVELAGELRLEAAAPSLVTLLKRDWDWYNEQIGSSLARIGTDRAVDAIVDAYAQMQWYERLYAAGALGDMHTDRAVRTLMSLYASLDASESTDDDEDSMRQYLASELSQQWETDAIEPLRQYCLECPDDSEWTDVVDNLLALSILADVDLPEREQWQQDYLERRKRLASGTAFVEKLLPSLAEDEDLGEVKFPEAADWPATVGKQDVRVGRNDPCPCGSGKKFKKCCLRTSTEY